MSLFKAILENKALSPSEVCDKGKGLALSFSNMTIFFLCLSQISLILASPIRDQLLPSMGRADDISISAFCCCILRQKSKQSVWLLSWRKVKYRIFQTITSILLTAKVTRMLDTNSLLESNNKYHKRLEYGEIILHLDRVRVSAAEMGIESIYVINEST